MKSEKKYLCGAHGREEQTHDPLSICRHRYQNNKANNYKQKGTHTNSQEAGIHPQQRQQLQTRKRESVPSTTTAKE